MKFIKPKPRSVLGLDIGQKRIGLAYCDALNITVSILPAVIRTKDLFELDTIKKQVMENTQVRFANISIKVSDEFMSSVDEERKYDSNNYLV